MHGIIIGDTQTFNDIKSGTNLLNRSIISRTPGAHRIASLLRKENFNIEVLDFISDWTTEEFTEFISYFKPDFLGVSFAISSINETHLENLFTAAKKLFPDIKIIAGGQYAINRYHNRNNEIDYFFSGSAEGAVNNIIKYLKTGQVNLLQVDNYAHNLRVINCNKHYPIFDVEDMRNDYLESDYIQPTDALSLEGSRGCIFKCTFCDFPHIGKNSNDYIRSKESIKDEMLTNYNRWGVTHYILADDTFNDNELKIEQLYEISQELPFKPVLAAYMRSDLIKKHNNLQKLYDTGFRSMFFGVESPNKETGRISVRKSFTGISFLEWCSDIKTKYPDMSITASMIVGLPGDKQGDIEKFIEKSISMNYPIDNYVINFLQISKVTTTEQSEFTKNYPKYGIEEMSLKELINRVEESGLYDSSTIFKNISDVEKFYESHVAWKHKTFDIVDAIQETMYLNRTFIGTFKSSGFYCIQRLHTGDSLDYWHSLNRRDYDWQKLYDKTYEYVEAYKQHKINFAKGQNNQSQEYLASKYIRRHTHKGVTMSEEQTKPSPMGESISLSDLQNLLQIVDIAAERGAFKASEFTQVGGVRDKLSTFLESVAQAQAEAAKATESVTESVTESETDTEVFEV